MVSRVFSTCATGSPLRAMVTVTVTRASGEIRPDVGVLELMLGVGNLCIGAANSPRYDALRMVELVIAGLHVHCWEPGLSIGS
jgi:hypothetical protein